MFGVGYMLARIYLGEEIFGVRDTLLYFIQYQSVSTHTRDTGIIWGMIYFE